MPERGRSTEVRDGKVKRSMFRSRSRSRKTKSDEEKTKQPRWKKVVKGMSRKGLKGSSRTNSVASESLEPTKMEVRQVVPPAPKADAVKAQPTKAPAPSLQLVLLLMEPLTRRFELLQLEFDSARARVVDILAQVPLSVTEEAIREQDFDGVLCDTGEVMTQGKLLVEFCKEKQVLVALPKGLDVEECNRLARPILSDFQVSKMVCRFVALSSQFPVVRSLTLSVAFCSLLTVVLISRNGKIPENAGCQKRLTLKLARTLADLPGFPLLLLLHS